MGKAHKKEASSAGISCVSSVLPPILNLGKNKTKMIAAVTASFGAGAAALAADIGEQYDNLKGAKTFSEKISQLNWGQALRKAGVQALIAGVSTGAAAYALDRPIFRNFGTKLKNLGYLRVKQILNKTGFSDETAEEFCRRFGVSKVVGRLFKVGDNIAGKIIQKVRHGTNGKTAIVGRKLDGHVNDVASILQNQGKQVDVFNDAFQGNKSFNIDGQMYTWADIKNDFENSINPLTKQRKYTSSDAQGWIADSDIPNTLMYKANQQWAQKLINEGYEVIDIGYPAGQNLAQSLFYNMELSTLFP